MIITRLTAENFGRHSKIDFSTHDSVVGIIGPNGSGKSTLLALLKFLFTGILEDKSETYIKGSTNVAGKKDIKKAEGEAHFIKDGQPGRIWRKITGANTARELEWNGEITTREADVAAKLEAILGADKHAISNAVFIPQGDVDRLLFGGQAERELLFTRLVNVAFLEKTVGVLDAKIKQESANTEDLTAVVDELRVQLAQAEGHVQDLDIEYRSLPDNSDRVKFIRRWYDLLQQCEQAASRRDAAAQAAGQHDTALKAKLRSSGLQDWGQLQVMQQTATATLNDVTSRRDASQRAKHAQELLQAKAAEARQLEVTAAEQSKRVTELADFLAANKSPTELYKILQQLERRALLQSQQEQDKAAQSKAMTEYTTHVANPVSGSDKLPDLQKEIDTLTQAVGALDLTLSALQAVAGKACGDKCPVCAQHVSPDIISTARLKDLQKERDDMAGKLKTARKELNDTQSRIAEYASKTSKLMDNYLRFGPTIISRETDLKQLPTGSVEEAKTQYSTVGSASVKHQELSTLLRQTQTRIAELKQAERPEDIALASTYQEPVHLALCAEWEGAKAETTRLQLLSSGVSALWQATTRAEADAQTAHDDWIRKSDALKSHLLSNPAMVAGVDPASLLTELTRYEGLERNRLACAGRLTQAKDQLQQLRKRDLEVAERLHNNAMRMQVVNELRQLREVLQRNALPMAYVEYQFRRLAALTQRNLSDLGANFTVDVSDTRPVAFNFSRLDEPGGETLDMMKLSGGQRVKLSIAFLISVQQLLIPEVGLLVLDEPSTHLDEESVEALKGLLLGMQQTLNNANHQVWVVDHHTTLQTAFGACLTLR